MNEVPIFYNEVQKYLCDSERLNLLLSDEEDTLDGTVNSNEWWYNSVKAALFYAENHAEVVNYYDIGIEDGLTGFQDKLRAAVWSAIRNAVATQAEYCYNCGKYYPKDDECSCKYQCNGCGDYFPADELFGYKDWCSDCWQTYENTQM